MKYRAILNDPGNSTIERPKQIYGQAKPAIDEWAATVLQGAVSDDATVEIYETVEKRIDTIAKPKPAEVTK